MTIVPANSGSTGSNGARIARYLGALAVVASIGAVRVFLTEGGGRGLVFPFLFFYPAIGFAAFIGGVGAGITATVFTVLIVIGFFPHYLPGPANWLWLSILSPALVFGFSRLKNLRDKSAMLAAESERLRFVMDRVSDWIFLTDDCGVIQYANQTVCTQLGCRTADLVGKRIEDLAAPGHRACLQDVLGRCRERAGVPTEIGFQKAGGGTVSVEVHCTAIAAGNTRVMHFAGRDITERKAIDRKHAEARRWEDLGVLAGGIAHEFNNLLTSIVGNASLARDGLSEDDPLSGLLRNIEAASDRSASLVWMMLATSGYKPRMREAFRVDRVLMKVLAERQTPGKAAVRTDTESAEFESDLRLIETLLWALISNAAESYGKGEGEVSVWIRAFKDQAGPHSPRGTCGFEEGDMPANPCLGIVVKDGGCGMTPELLSRAFDPFFSTKFMGRGLGLPAVRGIVRAHRGKLWVQTAPGEGTRVEVWLPGAGYDEKVPV